MATEATEFEAEEFWDDLLAFVEERRVIPVVGPELLTIEEAGKPVPLYRAVAERLLKRYGLLVELRPRCELSDAVGALAADGRRIKDLYRPVHDILQKLLAEQTDPLPALRELASIRHFDLFATTTPDDLLARALDIVRFGGAHQTEHIEYAPKLPTERRRDIPELPSSQYTAVFYLFGKADVSPFYAIHDEDALEFPYSLQAGGGPERMFSQLRSRNLIVIGCNFAGWLSRYFLRLSNSERLFSDQRTKKEFLIGEETANDRELTVFLKRFSQDTRCYPGDARSFVAELYRRWRGRNPHLGADGETPALPASTAAAARSGDTIFVSYSSDDIGAARQLFDGLQELGGDVAWFDKAALKPGDDWEKSILSAIQRCHLFLPLISKNTEQRTEGFFRLEWSEAADRARKIEGRKFIIPIAIDAECQAPERYMLVPDRFRRFQFNHAPAGRITDELSRVIQDELRTVRRVRTA